MAVSSESARILNPQSQVNVTGIDPRPFVSELQSRIVAIAIGNIVATGTAGCTRSTLERLHEGYEPVPFKRKNQVRERCSLKLLREERPLAVRLAVDDDRSPGQERKREPGAFTFDRVARDDGDRRQISVQRTSDISHCCREQNLMSESNQCLRQSFKQRHIGADEYHFYHYGVSLIQPGVEPIPDRPR